MFRTPNVHQYEICYMFGAPNVYQYEIYCMFRTPNVHQYEIYYMFGAPNVYQYEIILYVWGSQCLPIPGPSNKGDTLGHTVTTTI